MSFEDIIKFFDSLIVPIIVGILSAGLTIYTQGSATLAGRLGQVNSAQFNCQIPVARCG